MTVFHTDEDEKTRSVLNYFQSFQPDNVRWNWWSIEKPQLMRRAIGRNLAALKTAADWVWFADCDMAFGEGALDSVSQSILQSDSSLIYPRHILLHRSHALGDQAIARATQLKVIDLAPEEFTLHRYRRAIGGVQIVRGEVARQYGYCTGRRWQKTADTWQRCRGDVAFRRNLSRHIKTHWEPIEIPNLYRLRHSQCGRSCPDVTL